MRARMLCCALVIGSSLVSAQTVRIRCANSESYTASDGTVWRADQYSAGGQQLYIGYPLLTPPIQLSIAGAARLLRRFQR
jgi:hypothetical protein